MVVKIILHSNSHFADPEFRAREEFGSLTCFANYYLMQQQHIFIFISWHVSPIYTRKSHCTHHTHRRINTSMAALPFDGQAGSSAGFSALSPDFSTSSADFLASSADFSAPSAAGVSASSAGLTADL